MRLLLDTVTFVWALRSPELISRKATAALKNSRAVRELSALSISELAIESNSAKLDIGRAELGEGIPIVPPDRAFSAYKEIQVIW